MTYLSDLRTMDVARIMFGYLTRLLGADEKGQIEMSVALAEYHEAVGEERSA